MRKMLIAAPYLHACSRIRSISSWPEIPSGKPAWLRVQGMSDARLFPASTTRSLRWKRAR